MITIELSTIIPRVTINAASVTVFNSMLNAWNRPKEMKMVIGIVEAATSATLIGSRSITTAITATIAMTSSRRKFFTLSSTTWLWSVMRKMVTSSGSSC